ncbi:MAG: hypothetical protein COA58_09885 [Bacteroidetes bacterium]|nr:MAG: hypothetical protein COA58_09885 [Bacteroidota bacterium]
MKLILKNYRRVASLLLLVFVLEIFSPFAAYALTGGPSQPEVQGFQPVGASDMVNLFSGNFSYNIPLLDVDGYPINLSYSSGITNDQEASWVGLGWNINPGVINRSMRGLPDDFQGDLIKKEFNLKHNLTIGGSFSPNLEFFGAGGKASKMFEKMNIKGSYSLGLRYNNYSGFAVETTAGIRSDRTSSDKGVLNGSLGFTSSADGLSMSPSVSYDKKVTELDKTNSGKIRESSISMSTNYSTLGGFKNLTIGVSAERSTLENGIKVNGRIGGRSNVSAQIGLSSYTPTINMPMANTSLSYSYKVGGEINGLHPNSTISGYVSDQFLNLSDHTMYVAGYGYPNTDLALSTSAMKDINRDWDLPFNKNTSMLPVTNFTYDFLHVSGQGVGGTFRPFRNDIGYVSDNYAQNISVGGSLGLEAGFGNTNHTGIDFEINTVNTETTAWTKNNGAASKYRFTRNRSEKEYEPYTYKQLGELSVDDEPEFYSNIQDDKAVRIQVKKGGFNSVANPVLVDLDGVQNPMNYDGYRKKRMKRNQTMSLISHKDRIARGDNGPQNLGHIPKHHTSEITLTRTDGARYIYGIPAYNRTQEETSFAVGLDMFTARSGHKELTTHMNNLDQANGIYSYSSKDNSVKNKSGIDHFYSNTTMPAYAHSYLLTSVLSPDYVDADKEPGPSDHDIGNYTRFKYHKLPTLYKWRSPFLEWEANYTEGLKSDFTDDKANYVYGEKELWFLNVVETKNAIAVFHTSPRNDGYGVRGVNGGIGGLSTLKLDKISLYAKKDYEDNGASAIPIKEVHFEYDYSLCPGIQNNDGEETLVKGIDINLVKGKLTLKRVYFTYGESNKAKFSPYTFDYSPTNPIYGLKNFDRWGNYKPNPANAAIFDVESPMTNSEYPYCEQDKTLADEYASAWTLTSIKLPSGGDINVEIEADDYAYVQDKTAMEMFQIVDVDNTSALLEDGITNDSLMNTSGIDDVHQYLKVKLKDPLNLSTTNDEFKEMYTNGIEELYFKCLVDISGSNHYEYVSGYGTIEDAGLLNTGANDFEYAWLKLEKVNKNGLGISQDVHPISKAAWNFGLNQMPKVVMGKNAPEDGGLDDFLRIVADASFVKGLIQALKGPMDVIKSNGGGLKISLTKSMVRLKSPDQKKVGGGLRVKRILVSDAWSTMSDPSTNSTQIVGTEYNYTKMERGKEISSGVAAWEPSIGGDENPFKLPIYNKTKKERLVAIKSRDYLEGPIGESFYPGASVGYSQVTVKSLGHLDITKHATGKIVHTFYTAREFPVRATPTTIKPIKSKTPAPFDFITPYSRDYMTVSQGYSIEINDMHGKPRSTLVYQEGNNEPISGSLSKYKSEEINDVSSKLVNTCTIIRPDGSIDNREIGVEFDFVMDFREQRTKGISFGINPNLTSFLAAFFPAIVPTVLPSFNMDDTKFRSAVTTKVIYRYGIVEETQVFDLGSKISTNNLAYDSETGLVLLTQTQNEFNDNIYNFSYPAHWHYDQMGQAYKNLNLEFEDVVATAGVLSGIDNTSEYFVPGDELLLDGKKRAWVVSASPTEVKLVTKFGNDLNGSYDKLKIIRSGRRNIIGTAMGSMVTKENPLEHLKNNEFHKVLTTSSQVFKDEWDTFCDCFEDSNSPMLQTANPYLNGLKGNWRPYKSYAYLTQRNHTWEDNNTNIREDGIYKNYTPFWHNSGTEWQIDENNWTWTSEITKFTPYGAEIENKDALNRYSAATFGYTKTIPTAVGSNMQYRELAFDGFEDYGYLSCGEDHFSFRGQGPILDDDSHTGSKSIFVPENSTVNITKTLTDCVDPNEN